VDPPRFTGEGDHEVVERAGMNNRNAEAAARGDWLSRDESYHQRRKRGINPDTPARIVEDKNDD
jgi:hypothetical protein